MNVITVSRLTFVQLYGYHIVVFKATLYRIESKIAVYLSNEFKANLNVFFAKSKVNLNVFFAKSKVTLSVYFA